MPDCRSCGLCCVAMYDQESFCDVESEDLERLGVRWVRRNVLFSSLLDRMCSRIDGAQWPLGAIMTRSRVVKAGPMKGCTVCICVALRGSVGNRVSCRVYDKRPKVCHEAVVPGDRTCRSLRREHLGKDAA